MASKDDARRKRHSHKNKKPRDSKLAYVAVRKCSACGKICYPTRQDARKAAKVAHPGVTMHVYSCEELPGIFWFHLTSVPTKLFAKYNDMNYPKKEQAWDGH